MLGISVMVILLLVGLGKIDVLIIFVTFMLLAFHAMSANKNAWAAFAAANKWQVVVPTLDDIPPAIRGIGEQPHTGPVILATLDNKVGRLYTYDYTYGMGDFQSVHSFTILRIELPKAFPHIVLDSQKNDDGVRRLFNNYQKIKLEDNFDKYFRVYIQADEQVDALSILTPDLMSYLIDNSVKLDVEIVGSSLYFIATEANQSKTEIQYMLESTRPVVDDIIHRANTLDYLPASSQEGMNLSARPLAPLTFTSQTKTFAVIITLLGLVLFGLLLYFARQTLRAM